MSFKDFNLKNQIKFYKRGSSSGLNETPNITSTISRVIMSSRFEDDKLPLNKKEENLLSNTVKDTTVYRGVTVLSSRLTPQQMKIVQNLKPGDEVPTFISSNNKNRFTSATESLSVAKSYAKGGDVQIVMRAVSNKNNTWANLNNLSNTSLSKNFRKDQNDYFRSDKEVLMKSNTKYEVIYIKVKKKK